jgi:CheY-like chemotaxis protein
MHDTKTILVVNDHPAMQDLLRSFSMDSLWSVETVPGPVEALNRILQKPYDLVLTGLRTSGETTPEVRGLTRERCTLYERGSRGQTGCKGRASK